MAGESLSLPRHCGHVLGHLSGGVNSLWMESWISAPHPALVLDCLGLSSVLGAGIPIPMGWGCLSLGA